MVEYTNEWLSPFPGETSAASYFHHMYCKPEEQPQNQDNRKAGEVSFVDEHHGERSQRGYRSRASRPTLVSPTATQHVLLSHVSGVPRQRGKYEDVEEEHREDVVEGEPVLALARGVRRHSLLKRGFVRISRQMEVEVRGGKLHDRATKEHRDHQLHHQTITTPPKQQHNNAHLSRVLQGHEEDQGPDGRGRLGAAEKR